MPTAVATPRAVQAAPPTKDARGADGDDHGSHGSEGNELSELTPTEYTTKDRIERLRRENRLLRQEIIRQRRTVTELKAQAGTEGTAAPAVTTLTLTPGSSQEEALLVRIQTLERKNAREVARRTAAEREYRYEIELLRLALDEEAGSSNPGTRGGGGSTSRPASPQTAFPPATFHGRTVSQGEAFSPVAGSPAHGSQAAAAGGGAGAGAAAVPDTPGEQLQKLYDARVAEHEQATNPWATNADTLFRQAASRREQRRMRLRGIADATNADGEDSSPIPVPGAGASASNTTGNSSLIGDDTDVDGATPLRPSASNVMPGAERFQSNPILLTPNAEALQPSRRVSKLLAASMRDRAEQGPAQAAEAQGDNNSAPVPSGRRGRARRSTLSELEADADMAGTVAGAPTAMAPVVNPNQIGVELKDDERTRSWYLKETLSVVLQQVVHRRPNTTAAAPTGSAPITSPAAPAPAAPDTPAAGDATQQMFYSASSGSDSEAGTYDDYGTHGDKLRAKPDRSATAASTGAAASPTTTTTATTGAPAAPSARKVTTNTVQTDDRGRVLVYKDVSPVALQRAIADTIHFHVHCVGNNPVLCKPHEARALRLGSFASENTDPNLRAAFSPEHMSEEVKEVQRAGSEKKPHRGNKPTSHTGEFRDDELEVTVHAPIIFAQVRGFVGLDLDRFVASLELSTWRQSMSPGKSGTTLLYFGDCVMKSMKDSEYEFLMQRYLPLYVPYCERYPHSLLPQFYGVISVQWLKLGVTRRFFLMQNVFSTQYYIHRVYDIKGSTVNRTALKPGQPAPRTPFGALMLKDNDLPPQLIICGEHQRAILVAQLRSDVNFLQSLNIVDYSCMIGVRSRIFTREEGPSRTVLLRRQTVGGRAVDVGATVANGSLALDDTISLGAPVQDAETGAGSAGDADDDLFVCIRGCDGGLLSLPIYSPGDDTTAREDVYYIGIIDVLQEYNKAKKLENFAKGFVNNRKQISVIPPREYSERLCRVIERISV